MPRDDELLGGARDSLTDTPSGADVTSSVSTHREQHADTRAERAELGHSTPEFEVKYKSFVQPNPYRLTGKGTAQVQDGELILTGTVSSPFWFSRRDQVRLPLEQIFDLRRTDNVLSFTVAPHDEPRMWGTTPVTTRLSFRDEAGAQALAAVLPDRVSRQEVDRAEFEAKLAASSSGPSVTMVLLAANVAVYALFAIMGGGFLSADGRALIRWGSNFGPYTTDGQWWRLLTAAFLHGGLVHLAVNMWALYDVGRLCERIYGSGRFVVLYILSGILGSAASVWWNPVVNSVGASGALFGVIGATLVYMLDKRNGVPFSVMKQHRNTMAVFLIYAVVYGIGKTGIDNAAHMGGLVCGVITGFALAKPLGRIPGYGGSSYVRPGIGVALCIFMIVGLAELTPRTRHGFELEKRFQDDLQWFAAEEKPLLADTQQLLGKLSQVGKPDADAHVNLDFSQVLKKWDDTQKRFSAYKLDPTSKLNELQRDVSAYTETRYRAIVAVTQAIDALKESEAKAKAKIEEFNRLWKEADAIVKRINDRNVRAQKRK